MAHVFRNFNTPIIKALLEEIGSYRYEKALEVMRVEKKPTKTSKFYLESKNNSLHLYYSYSPKDFQKIMKVDEFENIPLDGWRLVLPKKLKR